LHYNRSQQTSDKDKQAPVGESLNKILEKRESNIEEIITEKIIKEDNGENIFENIETHKFFSGFEKNQSFVNSEKKIRFKEVTKYSFQEQNEEDTEKLNPRKRKQSEITTSTQRDRKLTNFFNRASKNENNLKNAKVSEDFITIESKNSFLFS